MTLRRLLLGLLAVVALGVATDLWAPFRADLRVFLPERMARLDTDMWRSYYDHKPGLLYLQLAQTLREEFHFPPVRSYLTAARAARAAFVFKGGHGRSDYERALPVLTEYFRDLHAVSREPFDVGQASRLELEWWIVHRERDRHAPGDLERALAEAAGALYRVNPDRLAVYGAERARAMTIRDSLEAAGGVPEAGWQEIDRHLVVSWRSLHDALASGGATSEALPATP
ncbi:MAG TPA: hypothetical protein VMH61_06820 [Candidatus Acidoferrales bacterium]|nr:hypothetical protein [Candidatus Acidoferrales bacterium]